MSLRTLCSTSNTCYRTPTSISCFDQYHAFGPIPTEAVRGATYLSLPSGITNLSDDGDSLEGHDYIVRPEDVASQTRVIFNAGGSLPLIEPAGNFQAQEGTEQQIAPTIYLAEDTFSQALSEDKIPHPPKSTRPKRSKLHSHWLVQDFTTCRTSCEECHCVTPIQPHTMASDADQSPNQAACQRKDEIPYSSQTADKPPSLSTRTVNSKFRLAPAKGTQGTPTKANSEPPKTKVLKQTQKPTKFRVE